MANQTPVATTIYDLLKFNEGWRSYVYDDQTGEMIRPGYTVQGHPTIGVGIRVDQAGALSSTVGNVWLREKVNGALVDLRMLPWFPALESDGGYMRAMGILDLAFQVGIAGVEEFHEMIAAIQRRDWAAAASAMRDSEVGRNPETRARNDRRAYMLATNQWPPADPYPLSQSGA